MRRALWVFGVLLLLLAAYLAFWPVQVDPEGWTPAPPIRPEGVWLTNERLARGEILAPDLPGPEAVAFDAAGRLLAGTRDGRVVRLESGGAVTTIATTGGRPLGVKVGADGTVFVADAVKGLLAIDAAGTVSVLANEQGGRKLGFTDDLHVLPDGSILFTDASWRWDLARFEMDVLEHRPYGRLLSFSPVTKKTELLAEGLYFPNGVAATPDGSAALLCETSSYRVRRVELTGEHRGASQVVLDGLPGFCDNVTWSPSQGAFWVAIGSPRDATLDEVSPHPFWRKVIARLPRALQPKPRHYAMAVLVRLDGAVLEVRMDPHESGWGPIASVIEHDGALYLGSYVASGVKKVPLE